MTEKYKFIKVPAFVSLIMVMIILLSISVDPTKTKAGTAKADKVVAEIKKEEEHTIDVVIIGDSEAYSSISPLEMYKKYGFTSYVAASPAQTSFQAYDMLTEVLKTQSPKLCIIETNLFFRNFSLPAAVIPKLEKAFPIFKYHNVWKEFIDPDYAYDSIIGTNYKGFRYSKVVNAAKNVNYMSPTDEAKEISDSNILYLERIMKLCEENDIEIMFIRTPSSKNWDYSKHLGAKNFAEEKNIPFADLNVEETVKINWRYDTSDRGDHMNYKGARKVTKFLGKFIDSNYDLPDRRNDPRYASWNEAYETYAKQIGIKTK